MARPPVRVSEFLAVHVDSSDLYKTGHMANRWFRHLMEQLEYHVSFAAPVRTGDMAAGITTEVRATPEAHRLDGVLESEADYTMFVLRGTTGPIMATNAWNAGAAADPTLAYQQVWAYKDPITGKLSRKKIAGVRRRQHQVGKKDFFMGVRPEPHSFYTQRTPRLTVRGQDPQNFLLQGWRATARTHRSMSHTPSFIYHP